MTESVAGHSHFDESRVLVKSLKEDCLNILREEVVIQLDAVDVLIVLKSVDQVNQTCIIKSAGTEVKLLDVL